MDKSLKSKRILAKHAHVKPTNEERRPSVKLEDLPDDVLSTILSKLPVKEVVRTSVLSSEWRCLWTTCPKLSFTGFNMCSHSCRGEKQHTRMFNDGVNAVLQKHHGKFVDELEIKFEFESNLVGHLNNWISFAMSSRTNNLAFDLAPSSKYWESDDRYVFPFELVDSESVSCLQCLQLCFVFLRPPSQFIGFPNLRKLYLHLVHATSKDLEDILSSCCNLEWLSIVRCHLEDEVKVVQPFSQLQYLQVIYCQVTKIEFHAAKLSTFVYNGRCLPIALRHTSKLENAHILFVSTIFQHAAAALLNGLRDVQNLTLQFSFQQLEFEGVFKWFANNGPLREEIPPCEYKYLKHMHVTGFRCARGQVEFLAHVVENAPAIEVMIVDSTDEIKPECHRAVRELIRRILLRLPPDAKILVRSCLL